VVIDLKVATGRVVTLYLLISPFEKMKIIQLTILLFYLLALFMTSSAWAQGVVEKITNAQGEVEQIAHYAESGDLSFLEVDKNGDGAIDKVQFYEDGLLKRLEDDSDFDGRKDTFIYFDEGERPKRVAKDSDADGKIDEVSLYHLGALAKVKKDRDGDGLFEITTRYEAGKARLQEVDSDSDGVVDLTVHLDSRERPRRIERDTDHDGRPDRDEFYEAGILASVSIDRDHNGRPEEEIHYRGGIKKTWEIYDRQTGRLLTTWFYDDKGQILRLEKDRDGDGRVDIRYLYKKGAVVRVEEDSNSDGRMDTWEDYLSGNRLAQRLKDLDNDGRADMVVYRDAPHMLTAEERGDAGAHK